MNISMTKTTHPGKLPPADRLGFGSVFTDHMFLMNYTDREGWHNARIVPFGPISMSPAASVLHYGTEVFEGLKAYRRPDGGPGRSWLRQVGGVLQRRGGQPLHGRRLPRRGRG